MFTERELEILIAAISGLRKNLEYHMTNVYGHNRVHDECCKTMTEYTDLEYRLTLMKAEAENEKKAEAL